VIHAGEVRTAPATAAAARVAPGGGSFFGSLARLRARMAALGGWRRALVAVALGVLLALALPPFHLVPLAVVALTGLLWLIDASAGPRGAFAVGWLFGFGHFLAGLYWIVNALLLFGLKYLPVYPIVVGFLPSILAVFVGLAAAATRAVPVTGPARVLAFAGFWTAAEWLRGNVFSGFPWNLAGYMWAFSDPMLQLVSLVGVYGLGLVSIAALGMPAAFGMKPALGDARRATRRGVVAVIAGALALVAAYGYGTVRLAGAPPLASLDGDAVDRVPGVVLRVVQPNVEQVDKWSRERHAENFNHHLALSVGPGWERVTHTFWPETAATFFVADEPLALEAIARAVPNGGILATGAPRRAVEKGERRIWNSLIAIDGSARVVGTFDKFHLVPLGEYVPLKGYLPLTKVVQGASDYSAGTGPRTLRLPGLPPVSPLICYEVIFPAQVIDRADRPQWLLNITNDGWYGDSPGPRQHFAQARLRAVEEGLPLVRSANTGISGVIDAYGRVVASLALGRTGVIDAPLPRALAEPGYYARFGDWIVLVMLALTAFLCMLAAGGHTTPADRNEHATT